MTFPVKLPIPSEVLKIAKKLEDAGFETWCVGGAIRDNLLRLENHDFDLTTSAPPAEVQRLFRRTVPVGIRSEERRVGKGGRCRWRTGQRNEIMHECCVPESDVLDVL